MNTPEVFARSADTIPAPNTQSETKTGPVRTCIASRCVKPQHELLRVVARTEGDGTVTIVPDPHRRLDGRGAWITPDQQAFEIAEKRRAFSRALKVPVDANLEKVREYIEKSQEKVPEH